MLTLNTLRTRFGIVLSVVIVLALLAFILSLGPEMGLFGNDQNPTVAEIDGDEISLAEFSQEYNDVKTSYYFMSGRDSSDERQIAQFASEAWSNLLFDKYLLAQLEDAGVVVTDEETIAMLKGEVNSAVYASVFGASYTPAINSFLTLLDSGLNSGATQEQLATYNAAWEYIKKQAMQFRHLQKFAGLLKAGSYVNALEVEQGVKNAANVVDGRYVPVKLSTIAPDQVEVKESEVEAYYNSHKNNYRKSATRELAYVVFEVLPTEADEAAIAQKAQDVAQAMKDAVDEQALQAVFTSNGGVISPSYAPVSSFTDAEAVLFDGEVYGPELQDNKWVISKALKSINAPEKLGFSAYIVAGDAVAQSDNIVKDAQAGEDFASLAEKYQLDADMYNYFTVDEVAFADLASQGVEPLFAAKLAEAKVGDVLVNKTLKYTQIVKVDKVEGKPQKHILAGVVNLNVVPSTQTASAVSSEASAFAASAKGSVAAFQKAAEGAARAPRTHTLAESDFVMSPMLDNSRELVRWAQAAEVGQVSKVLKAGEHYVVAVVTSVDESRYQPLAGTVRTMIISQLQNEKRMEMLKSEYAGMTIEEAAAKAGVEAVNFEGVKYSDTTVGQLYGDVAVVGAVTSAEAGNTTKVVYAPYSNTAVVYVVDAVNAAEAPQTAEAEKLRQQTTLDESIIRSGVGLAVESATSAIETSNTASMHF